MGLFKKVKSDDEIKKENIKKAKENLQDPTSLFPIEEIYDVRQYDDLKFDLRYAHDEILIDNDEVILAIRKYKKCLIKILLVHKFEAVEKYDLSNESINKYVAEKGFLEEISIEDINQPKEVRVTIFKEKSEDIKQYCFLNAKTTKTCYNQYFIYEHNNGYLMQYRALKDYGCPVREFHTALFFDLSCVDQEER